MPKKNKLAKNKISISTQRYLDISEIKDDVVIMRDGTLRAVVLVSSINFALKSEDEQNAIISSYVSFINNIDFPLQIVIQSRELNIENYLKDLNQRRREQTNELLKIQTDEYIQYIKELISMGKIMSKRFYIVVPYDPLTDKRKGFWSRVKELFSPVAVLKLSEEKFRKRKHYLDQRLSHVQTALNSVGLKSQMLDTQGLIELYYNVYNPSTSQFQKMVDVGRIQVEE